MVPIINYTSLTVRVKLEPFFPQKSFLQEMMSTYIELVNKLVDDFIKAGKTLSMTSKHVVAQLPSAVKNQAIRDAKSIYKKFKKKHKKSILKKPICIWNNQNYKVLDNAISIPVFVNGRRERVIVKALISDYQRKFLGCKLGALRIVKKGDKLYAEFSVEVPEKALRISGQIMGIDLGLKNPAVVVTEKGEVLFVGNGRLIKFMRRRFALERVELGNAKQLNVMRRNRDKEARWMKDLDHKISRLIIDFAKRHNVSVIRMECLENIRNTARTSRKNAKNLHRWSFHRLMMYIKYKAKLEGIKLELVDPRYTTKRCPSCGKINYPKDRQYRCICGFRSHRDIVGARNIINATVVDGVSRKRKTIKRESLPAHATICTGMGRGDGTLPKASPSNLRELRITEMDLPTTT